MKEEFQNLIRSALKSLGIEAAEFIVEHPADLKMGDYSTNVAIKYGHKEEIKEYLDKNKPEEIEKIELAGPGFINFYLSKEFFRNSLKEIIKKGEEFGKNEILKSQKIMVEYTDPNVMKAFHVGHLMSNTIGEAISRIIGWHRASVIRANYYSDVGLNIAKAVRGLYLMNQIGRFTNKFLTPTDLNMAYVIGVQEFEKSEKEKESILEINKIIYGQKPDITESKWVTKWYQVGKEISLNYFKQLYDKLGSKFDWVIGESEVAEEGKNVVLFYLKSGLFEKSEEAIVFRGEKYNPRLHTRVFITKEGLPTYEAKELALTAKKFNTFKNLDKSIVITANEQNDYFRVVIEALKQISPEYAYKTKHLSHGMLRLPTGKMSSRTGDIITAEALIEEVKTRTKGDEQVAIGAIKYMILRQSIGNDVIFDFEKSVSTEGDSGVYLQYAYARANSLLGKVKTLTPSVNRKELGNIREIEKLLYRFPEVVERAGREYAPHYITTYLTELAGSFNNFYAHEQVIGDSPESGYRLTIVQAFNIVMKNGLTILGIPAPERM